MTVQQGAAHVTVAQIAQVLNLMSEAFERIDANNRWYAAWNSHA